MGKLQETGQVIRWPKLSGPSLGGMLWSKEGMLGLARQVASSTSDSLGILEIVSVSLFSAKDISNLSTVQNCQKVVSSLPVFLCITELQNCSINAYL